MKGLVLSCSFGSGKLSFTLGVFGRGLAELVALTLGGQRKGSFAARGAGHSIRKETQGVAQIVI